MAAIAVWAASKCILRKSGGLEGLSIHVETCWDEIASDRAFDNYLTHDGPLLSDGFVILNIVQIDQSAVRETTQRVTV